MNESPESYGRWRAAGYFSVLQQFGAHRDFPARCNVRPRLCVRSSEDRTIPIDLETVGEARLVVQALAGSQSAFEQIVGRYQRPVVSLIARITGDRAMAEDLAQETFVKAFRSLAA